MKRNSVPNLNAKMSNPRRSSCDFNIWSCCARLWDNFHQVWPSTTCPFLNFYADTLCHAVIDLDLWPLDLELLQHFGCQAFKLCTKFEGNRIIYRWVIDDLTHLHRAILGMEHDWQTVLRGAWTQLHQTWRGHVAIIPTQQICFSVRISCCTFKREQLKVEWCWKRRQILHCLTPCEN